MPNLHNLQVNVDDRGLLYEVLRTDWPALSDHAESIKQVYMVQSIAPMTVRAYHRHVRQVDWYCIVKGSAKFVLFTEDAELLPDRNGEGIAGLGTQHARSVYTQVVTLTAQKPQILICPRGVYHGWMNLEPNTMMLTVANQVYSHDPATRDEERVPGDTLGVAIWKVLGR